MIHSMLLVSEDAGLAERVRRALPGPVPAVLELAPHYRPSADPRGWLLILLDCLAVAPDTATAALVASPPGAGPEVFVPPVLWFGEFPRLTSACDALPGGCRGIADFLDRNLASSKLAFILQQHLAAAYLQRQRGPAAAFARLAALRPAACAPELPADYETLRCQLNNTLTGILGNAELVLEAGRRLPPSVQQRLARISDLAGQMRELMQAWPGPDACLKSPA